MWLGKINNFGEKDRWRLVNRLAKGAQGDEVVGSGAMIATFSLPEGKDKSGERYRKRAKTYLRGNRGFTRFGLPEDLKLPA